MTNIKKLSDFSHLRERIFMYLGGTDLHTQQIFEVDNDNNPILIDETWVPALYTGFREILDNASDEVIAHNNGTRINITYDPQKMIFSVEDDGRGIPIDYSEEYKTYLATMVLSEPRTGRNFGERKKVAGTNGIGSSATSNTSEWFNFRIIRDGKKFTQSFSEGKIGSTSLTINPPVIKDTTETKTGTYVEYKPSSIVYKNMILPERFVRSRIVEFAACNPNYKIYYNGKHIKVKPKIEQTLFSKYKTIQIEIDDTENDFTSKFILVPNFVKDGDHYHSIVNNIPSWNGGTHIDAFRLTFFKNLLTALEKESKKRKLTPNRSDLTEGLLIYNVTFMDSPNFDAQSKTRLTNEEAGKIIQKYISDPEFYSTIVKKNKEWIDEIYLRCAERTKKKDASDLNKLQKKNGKVKVAALMDATGKDRSKTILTITEGQSALGQISSVRDPAIHGGFPLKGKVLNVNGMTPKDVLSNKVIQDLLNAIGLVIGQEAKREELRYGTLWIATDQDYDGCFSGNTEVHTLKYGPVRMDELESKFNSEPFYVWSRDKNNRQVPGLAHSPRITKRVNQLYKITLDNDEVIEATGNHPFRMVDGSYTRVESLSIGDSLCPYEFTSIEVKDIEIIQVDNIPVWDITVEKYHNFALSSGCYVHNSNISALVVNFFYTFWPELLQDKENPFLNIFQTPFIIAEKNKQRKYWYASNYDEFKPDEWKGWSITRAKGLGTLVKEDWRHAIDNPVLDPIYDDGNLKDTLDLIFNGAKADDRKNWMGI